MSEVRHFRRGAMRFVPLRGPLAGEGPPQAEIARLVGPAESRTMGVGIGRFEAPIEWAVRYDEVMVVLEGRFRVILADRSIEAEPGDVIWIPEGTRFTTEGEKAVVCYALWPADYHARAATDDATHPIGRAPKSGTGGDP
jgi:ethanolamine utilization protein EutQ (cupin superfamily)